MSDPQPPEAQPAVPGKEDWRVSQQDRRTLPEAKVRAPAWALVLLSILVAAILAAALWGWSLQRRLGLGSASLQERIHAVEQAQASRQALDQGAFEDIGQSLHTMDGILRELGDRDAKQRGPQIERNKATIQALRKTLGELREDMDEKGRQLDGIQRQLTAASGESGEGLIGRVAQLSESLEAQQEALAQAAQTLQKLVENQEAHDNYRLTTNQALLRLQAQMGTLAAKVEELAAPKAEATGQASL